MGRTEWLGCYGISLGCFLFLREGWSVVACFCIRLFSVVNFQKGHKKLVLLYIFFLGSFSSSLLMLA